MEACGEAAALPPCHRFVVVAAELAGRAAVTPSPAAAGAVFSSPSPYQSMSLGREEREGGEGGGYFEAVWLDRNIPSSAVSESLGVADALLGNSQGVPVVYRGWGVWVRCYL